MAAIAIAVSYKRNGRGSLIARSAASSVALGLGFAACFPYAFVIAATGLVLLRRAIRRRTTESIAKVVVTSVLPGLLIAACLCGYSIAHFPKNELWYGAHSLREMAVSLIDASLYRPSPIAWRESGTRIARVLLGVLAVLAISQFIVATVERRRRHPQMSGADAHSLALSTAAIAALTLLFHWIAFQFFGLLLPLTRTGMFFLPIFMLLIGAIAASTPASQISRWLGRAAAGCCILLALFFGSCLRSEFFYEYEFDADVADVYSEIVRLDRLYVSRGLDGFRKVVANPSYASPLNFYRITRHPDVFPEFTSGDQNLPADKDLYIIDRGIYQDLIAKEGLLIVYRGKSTGIAIAIKEERRRPLIE